jgi:aspartate 1-decarboxylase
MLKSKIHRAKVTEANVDYVGSIRIDAALMEASDLLPGEQVHVVDVDNGARLQTYVIEGTRDSGVIAMNGAAARLINPDDLIIIISYAQVTDQEAHQLQPRVVHVDSNNRIARLGTDPGEVLPAGTAI